MIRIQSAKYFFFCIFFYDNAGTTRYHLIRVFLSVRSVRPWIFLFVKAHVWLVLVLALVLVLVALVLVLVLVLVVLVLVVLALALVLVALVLVLVVLVKVQDENLVPHQSGLFVVVVHWVDWHLVVIVEQVVGFVVDQC